MNEAPTHAEQIRAIRDLQREAASTGKPLSFAEAREELKQRVEKRDPNDEVKALAIAIASLKAELDSVKVEIAQFRITGIGFSGEGPNGIMFTADALPLDDAPPADERIPLEVKEESGVVVADCTTLQIIGKRAVAEVGANANTAKVTIGTVEITQDASQKAEAATKIVFTGNVDVTGETAGDGIVTVDIPGIDTEKKMTFRVCIAGTATDVDITEAELTP